jgi:flagellar basal body rod protein FlgC
MLPAISTAASGLAAQSRRVEEVAQGIASAGTTQPAAGAQPAPSPQVRIGALPVGTTVASLAVTLAETEHAYRANAAVVEMTADMLAALFETLDTE